MKNNKYEIYIATGYTLIMAIGMAVAYRIFGYSYSDINIVKVLVLFEVLMTMYAIFFYRKLYSGMAFKKIHINPLLVYYSLIMIFIFILYMVKKSYLENLSTITTILITTICIAVSEELVYRGILLNGFMKNNTKVKSIVYSAIFFSLLHAVNAFAGFSISSVLIQLLNTFIHGLAMGCLMVKTKNLFPFIIFHFIWDFVMLSSSFAKENAIVILIVLISDIIISFILLINMSKEKNLQDNE